MRDISRVSPGYVAAFGRDLCEGTHRRLDLLNAIEETCGALRFQVDQVRGQIRDVMSLAERINRHAGTEQLDPSGDGVAIYERTQDGIAGYARELEVRRASAVRDPDLREDDEVVEAFDEMIAAEHELHGAIGDLIVAITEHDADRSPKVGEPVASADELFTLLRR